MKAMKLKKTPILKKSKMSTHHKLMKAENSNRKLRKLPHVFSKVLELPFRSDADVAVEEGPDFFRFVVKIKVGPDMVVGNVRAHAVEIHPGVIKIVVRNDHKHVKLSLDELDIDTWRFRLPSSTLPELATAVFVDGKLTVTVPKGGSRRELVKGREVWAGGNKVILVQ